MATVTATALFATMASPAAARPTARSNPNTPVASDGTVARAQTLDAKAPSVSRSFAGTGISAGTGARAADEGGVGVSSIIGPDERYRINPTTSHPYRAMVLVTFSGGRCTGWMYGANVVGTAGHCVHTGGSGGAWRTNVVVYPGYNGSGGAPYGSCTAASLHSVSGWTVDGNHEYDYGTIKLSCSIGNTVGWLGYWWQSASLNGQVTRVCGYPGDKPLEQWCGDLNNGVQATVTSSTAQKVYYLNDTVGGVSGAAVFQNRSGCGYCSMAFHGYGGTSNSGKRITEAAFANMQYWTSL